MSYCETYEFLAIDRALTPAEQRALRAISTRATVTPTRFYNFYDWGELKADPREMLRRYFDVFVYTCEDVRWGMLRFPADRVATRRWRPYVAEQRGVREPGKCASFVTRHGWTVLTLSPAERTEPVGSADDGAHRGDDERVSRGDRRAPNAEDLLDDANWGVPLALLRTQLLSGDLPGLYLAWLCSVQGGERRAATCEPPRPAGLDRGSGVLSALAEFLGLDPDLMAVAFAEQAPPSRTAGDLLGAARTRVPARHREPTAAGTASRNRRLPRLGLP